jgi:hypothetical protein
VLHKRAGGKGGQGGSWHEASALYEATTQSALSGMLRVQAEAGRAFQSRSEPRSKQGGQ